MIIGCDPDSGDKGSAYAIAIDGKLADLKHMTDLQAYQHYEAYKAQGYDIELHIEDLIGVSTANINKAKRGFVKTLGFKKSYTFKEACSIESTATKRGEGVGMCKHAQKTAQQAAQAAGIDIYKHKISSNLKDSAKGREYLKRVYGWTKPSNEDTRSAVHFMAVGISQSKFRK